MPPKARPLLVYYIIMIIIQLNSTASEQIYIYIVPV